MWVLLQFENCICRCTSDPEGEKKKKGFTKSPAKEVWKINGMAGGERAETFNHKGGCHIHTGRGVQASPCTLAACLAWEGACCKNIPCLWRQILHFLGKSLPYLQKEQRPLFRGLVRFWHFETSPLMLLAGSCCSFKWSLVTAQRKLVLGWLTFACRRFRLCDFMPPPRGHY